MWRAKSATENPTAIQHIRLAFTLIELLVVVAIIAVLIALLTPALKNAKEQANAVVCGTNLRSLGLGFQMYADDNLGHYPRASPGQVADQGPEDWIKWRSNAGDSINNSAILPYLFTAQNTAVPSSKFKAINLCPMDVITTHPKYIYSAPPLPVPPTEQYAYSYSMNWQVHLYEWGYFGSLPYLTPLHHVEVKSPAGKILLVESVSPNDGASVINGNLIPQFATELLSLRHGGKSNASYFDGHVEPTIQSDGWNLSHYDPQF